MERCRLFCFFTVHDVTCDASHVAISMPVEALLTRRRKSRERGRHSRMSLDRCRISVPYESGRQSTGWTGASPTVVGEVLFRPELGNPFSCSAQSDNNMSFKEWTSALCIVGLVGLQEYPLRWHAGPKEFNQPVTGGLAEGEVFLFSPFLGSLLSPHSRCRILIQLLFGDWIELRLAFCHSYVSLGFPIGSIEFYSDGPLTLAPLPPFVGTSLAALLRP
jgi:hypothetical protein